VSLKDDQLGSLILQRVDSVADSVEKLGAGLDQVRRDVEDIRVELARKDGMIGRLDKLETEAQAARDHRMRWGGIVLALSAAFSLIAKYLLP